MTKLLLPLSWKILGSLRSNDADGNKNVKKKTTTLRVHHAFLCISLPALPDHDVKMPNFAFYGVRKQATTKCCFSFCTWIWSPGIQLQEGSPTFDTSIKLGGLCNDDSDGNENNVKKEKGLKSY